MVYGKQKSLIICATPLQMLIAEKIIELNDDQDFYLIAFFLNDSNKYSFYFEKLKNRVIKSFIFFPISESGRQKELFINFLKFRKRYNFEFGEIYFKNYYLASIDSRYIQWIISNKNFNSKVFTFDDGVANIFKNGIYYQKLIPSLIKRIVWRFLGVTLYMEDIKKESYLHYTIYHNVKNIIDNTFELNLFVNDNNDNNNKCYNLFLGQPYKEISHEIDSNYISKILDRFEIDFYFPHPRENSMKRYENVEYIDSNLVFEDFLKDFMKQYNCSVRIFSFISSAGINVSNFENVQVVFLRNNELKDKMRSFYEILDFNNIQVIDI